LLLFIILEFKFLHDCSFFVSLITSSNLHRCSGNPAWFCKLSKHDKSVLLRHDVTKLILKFIVSYNVFPILWTSFQKCINVWGSWLILIKKNSDQSFNKMVIQATSNMICVVRLNHFYAITCSRWSILNTILHNNPWWVNEQTAIFNYFEVACITMSQQNWFIMFT
jgi:hypothetical protein